MLYRWRLYIYRFDLIPSKVFVGDRGIRMCKVSTNRLRADTGFVLKVSSSSWNLNLTYNTV